MDWLVTDATLVYAKYNRGFKPGGQGFGNAPDLDSEIIDSVEIGAKTRLFGDTVSLIQVEPFRRLRVRRANRGDLRARGARLRGRPDGRRARQRAMAATGRLSVVAGQGSVT